MGEEIAAGIRGYLKKHYTNNLANLLDAEVQRMKTIVNLANSFYEHSFEKGEFENKISGYKSDLQLLINEAWQNPEEKKFNELHAPFLETLQTVLGQLDKEQIREQTQERFIVVDEDRPYIRFLKRIKHFAFVISRIPVYVVNLFRKKKKKVHYWKHVIPVQNLAARDFQSHVISRLTEVTEIIFHNLCAEYRRIKTWEEVKPSEEGIPKSDMLASINAFKEKCLSEVESRIDMILDDSLNNFNKDYFIAGTIEFPNTQLSEAAIEEQLEDTQNKWSKNRVEWVNAIYALFEEWRSDLELCTLKYKTLEEFKEFQSAQIRKLAENIDPEINEIQALITTSSNAISDEKVEIQKELKRIKYQVGKRLDKELLPQLCDKLSGSNITNLINKLEINVSQAVEELSDEHVIVKSGNYDKPVKSEDISKISLNELIAFEILNAFMGKLSKIKKELFYTLETATTEVKDLDQIITFSLSSAIAVKEAALTDESNPATIALEGLKRASSRLSDARQKLEESLLQNSQLMEEAINEFCESVMKLTVNEKIGELRLRITKAKAARQAEEVKAQLKEKMKQRKSNLLALVKNTYGLVSQFISDVGDKFILTAGKPILSKQVSDFLVESQQSIDKLPLIYRRLYRIEPLEDMELFEGRTKEFEAVKIAFENWNNGRYAATVVVNEKWGGLTSFINYVVKEANLNYPITRYAPTENSCTEESFIALMPKIFENDSLESIDHTVDYLNSGVKRIVVLEDLQNLYLRKINGFSALFMLFQLMSRTNKNVFWLTSSTLYTWSYLSKTINIQDYFSYVIQMSELSNEQMVNIILKRNRISGFHIQFEASAEQLADKKYLKMDEREQQQHLQSVFFSGLNEFAKSNISLALLFWLQSTKDIDDDTITIGTFQKPDLNFLSTLSVEKVHILYVLIIHDGLTAIGLSEVMHMTLSTGKLKLFSLEEDGIIYREDEFYLVNPFVYRNIVSLLKTKNLIH